MIRYLLIWEFVVMLESGMDAVNSTPTGWTISHPNEDKKIHNWAVREKIDKKKKTFHNLSGKTSIMVILEQFRSILAKLETFFPSTQKLQLWWL